MSQQNKSRKKDEKKYNGWITKVSMIEETGAADEKGEATKPLLYPNVSTDDENKADPNEYRGKYDEQGVIHPIPRANTVAEIQKKIIRLRGGTTARFTHVFMHIILLVVFYMGVFYGYDVGVVYIIIYGTAWSIMTILREISMALNNSSFIFAVQFWVGILMTVIVFATLIVELLAGALACQLWPGSCIGGLQGIHLVLGVVNAIQCIFHVIFLIVSSWGILRLFKKLAKRFNVDKLSEFIESTPASGKKMKMKKKKGKKKRMKKKKKKKKSSE